LRYDRFLAENERKLEKKREKTENRVESAEKMRSFLCVFPVDTSKY